MVNFPLEKQLSRNYQPQTIQLYFDGLEVLQVKNGQKVFEKLVPADFKPFLIEMRWDGQVVYALKPRYRDNLELKATILINRLLLVRDNSDCNF